MSDIIKTGGGTFDPDDRHIYFLATDLDHLDSGGPGHDHFLIAVNELKTQQHIDGVLRWIDRGKIILLDSGIYNLTTTHANKHNVTMDQALALAPDRIDGFEELWDRYIKIVTKYSERFWGYIELDQGGMDNKRKTRTKLEALGLRPMPVYHPLNDGWNYFDELAQRYDRICFGNIVQAPRGVRLRLVATVWQRRMEKYPHLWIHLLGLTPNEWLNAYTIDSTDSSAWLSSVRWSGYKEHACGATMGGMPRDFQYVLGSNRHEEAGWDKGTLVSAWGVNHQQRNWRHLVAAMEGEQ